MTGQTVTILERQESAYVSTFFSEIVTCRLANGSVKRLLLKRGGMHADPSYGHRGGVEYEARIYRTVLEPLGTSVPRFYGGNLDRDTGETTLLIEYVEDATRLESADPAAVLEAARWIGSFHRLNEPRAAELAGIVNQYDEAYYLGWMRRTLTFARHLSLSWLPRVGRCFEALAGELVEAPLTVVHGEYYPMNILVQDGRIVPVDWESAALAIGEIDLASLTEGWPEEYKRACQVEYGKTRWRDDPPAGFRRRLALSEMYLLLRWLGDRPEWATEGDAPQQFDRLQQLSQELEIHP